VTLLECPLDERLNYVDISTWEADFSQVDPSAIHQTDSTFIELGTAIEVLMEEMSAIEEEQDGQTPREA